MNVGNFVTATATSGFGAGNTSEFSACMQVVEDTGNTSADLSVTGTASPDPASATGTIMYDFTVGNAGPDPAEDTTFDSEFAGGPEPGLDVGEQRWTVHRRRLHGHVRPGDDRPGRRRTRST